MLAVKWLSLYIPAFTTRAETSENVPLYKCSERRFRSACAFTAWSEYSLGAFCIAKDKKFPHTDNEHWSDCADVVGWLQSSFGAHVRRYSRLSLSRSKGLSEILRDISTYLICRIDRTIVFHKWICNLNPEVRDILKKMWKRGEISPIFHNILLPFVRFSCVTGTRFSLRNKRLFKIREVEITRVDFLFARYVLAHMLWEKQGGLHC